MNRLWLALLPDLRRFPPAERADALRRSTHPNCSAWPPGSSALSRSPAMRSPAR